MNASNPISHDRQFDLPGFLRRLYVHWERNQWSPVAIDFSKDQASFARSDDRVRDNLLWIFSQRFQAEINVAELLAPFFLAAPDYETRLFLATQIADEHRHVESVVRIYREVCGVEGGLSAVRTLAMSHLDPVAVALYEALDDTIRPLEVERTEDMFLRAVFGYHVIGEGVVGRTTQRALTSSLARLGCFPGLREAQQHAIRDELRHVSFGVAYVRARNQRDHDNVWSVVGDIIRGFRELAGRLEGVIDSDTGNQFTETYGVDSKVLFSAAMRQLELRLRATGLVERPRKY